MIKLYLAMFVTCLLCIVSDSTTANIRNTSTCIYDLNQDGVVTNTDLLLFLMNYGEFGDFEGDFDGNGSVGVSDFIVFMRYKGNVCQ